MSSVTFLTKPDQFIINTGPGSQGKSDPELEMIQFHLAYLRCHSVHVWTSQQPSGKTETARFIQAYIQDHNLDYNYDVVFGRELPETTRTVIQFIQDNWTKEDLVETDGVIKVFIGNLSPDEINTNYGNVNVVQFNAINDFRRNYHNRVTF